MPKKRDDEDMQATLASEKAIRKDKVQANYKKAVDVNGMALEQLNKN